MALLVARAQLGDLGALDSLLASIQEPLFRHVRTILGDEHDAEDALQEILLTISRRLGTLRDPRWFRPWSYRVATRAAIRLARKAKRIPLAASAEELENVAVEEADANFDADMLAALPDAVAKLPPASQIVIRMHYLDGLTHTEVAEALEISVGTVKSRLGYGLARLRAATGSPGNT